MIEYSEPFFFDVSLFITTAEFELKDTDWAWFKIDRI